MPYKDPEKRNARQREKYAQRKAEDPEYIAKRAAQQAALHAKKQCEDEAYNARRKADYDKWYAEFGKENARARKGYRPLEEYLAECEEKRRASNEYMKQWGQTEQGKRARTARSVMRRCGISIEEYDKSYHEQAGHCRICGVFKNQYGKDRLVVDHCHTTGKFRALLCSKCNCAIGLFEESEEICLSAIQYLKEIASLE